MASSETLVAAAAMAVVVTAALLPATASESFTVGDDSGWDVAVNYAAWASGKNFKAGDTLVFKPKSAEQDVVQVDEQSFNDCTVGDNAKVMSTSGPVAVVLPGKGSFFFICDAEGECGSGMKLAVNVH